MKKLNEWNPSTKSEALDWIESELNTLQEKLNDLNQGNKIQYEDYSELYDIVDQALAYVSAGLKLEESSKLSEELSSNDETHYYNEGYDAYMDGAKDSDCPYDVETEKEYQKYYNKLKSKAWHWGYRSAFDDDSNSEPYEHRMTESRELRESTSFIEADDYNKLVDYVENKAPEAIAEYSKILATEYDCKNPKDVYNKVYDFILSERGSSMDPEAAATRIEDILMSEYYK